MFEAALAAEGFKFVDSDGNAGDNYLTASEI